MSVAGVLKSASRTAPCPICSKDDWCQQSEDGALRICRRAEGIPGGIARIDKVGVPYWVFGSSGTARTGSESNSTGRPTEEAPEPDPIKHRFERAEPSVLDTVYRDLFERCGVTFAHESDLKKRGFTLNDIERLGYKSKPDFNAWEIIKVQLYEPHQKVILRVPGFSAHEYTNDAGDKTYKFGLDGPTSLMLPIRDRHGRIVAVQLDVDSGNPKYLPLTSYSRHGSKSKLLTHVPQHNDESGSKRAAVRLVGGVYKADLATLRTSVLTISSPNEYA